MKMEMTLPNSVQCWIKKFFFIKMNEYSSQNTIIQMAGERFDTLHTDHNWEGVKATEKGDSVTIQTYYNRIGFHFGFILSYIGYLTGKGLLSGVCI